MVKKSEVEHIFRAYDIRGIYGKDLNESIMLDVGKSFGTFIPKKEAVVSRDVRQSSLKLRDAFVSGLLSTGKSMEDVGVLPLGAAMFHAWQNKKYLAYITASHLPKEWNGVKFFHSNGVGFSEENNKAIKEIFMDRKFTTSKILGRKSKTDGTNIIDNCIKYLIKRMKPRKKSKVIIDCGNGCAGMVAPQLFKTAGFKTVVLYKEPDGNFPNRLPDIIDEELFVLKADVSKADFGVAYDGDADRMAVVDDSGRTLTPEEASYIILSELLKTRKGPIIANVECSRVIDKIAEKFKSKVVRVPVGHTFLMQAVHKERAVFGVEKSGHYTLPFLFPFDDALAISYYAACVISRREGKLSKLMEEIPKFPFGRFSYACPDSKKFQVIENIKKKLSAEYKNVNTMDGVRIDLKNGWVLFRASNTGPVIRLTVEADTLKDFGSIKVDFMKILETEMKKFGLGLAEEKK